MTALEASARKTRFRVGLNDWFSALGWSGVGAAGLWVVLVVVARLFAPGLDLLWCSVGLAGVAVAVSATWAWRRRRDLITAAAILDEAADLKERTSSGLYCQDMDDPFAKAALADAERLSGRIDVRSFIRLSWPPSLSFAGAALVFAIIITLLPISPLQARTKLAPADETRELARAEVKKAQRRLQSLSERVKKTPGLRDLEAKLQSLENVPVEKLGSRDQVRREAIKKIDHFSDAVKKQMASDQSKMREIKRMFRGLQATQKPQTPAKQLSQALASGDFRSAQKAVKQMQEQLARMPQKGNEEQAREMQKQLENLAKQLKSAAEQKDRKEKLQEQLEKSGVDKETAKRLLKNLTKKDIDQIKNLMKKQGASEKQMKDMTRDCQACRKAGKQASDMAQSAQQAAESMQGNSSMSDASQQLQELADQLNSLEAMDQQLSELQSILADAQDSKNDLSESDDGQCEQCNGRGCGACNGTGRKGGRGGMGNMGQGRGGRAPIEETATRFNTVRSPVHTTAGAIISKMFVDGEQVRGSVSNEVVELFAAGEREATDAIDNNTIPNQYRRPIKEFFSAVNDKLRSDSRTDADGDADGQTDEDPDAE